MLFKKKVLKFINFFEKGKFDLKIWLISFLALISTRLLIEALLLNFPARSLENFLALFMHTFLFFLLTYLLFLLFLKILAKERLEKINSFLLWSFVVVLFPPLLDRVIFQKTIYKSFYIFDSLQGLVVRFFTFFGKNPDWGITWGTRIVIIIALLGVSAYVFLKTKQKRKALIAFFGGYFLFFILGCFPSVVVYLIELLKVKGIFQVSQVTVAGYFLSPFTVFGLKNTIISSFMAKKLALIYLPMTFFVLIVSFFVISKQKCLALIKNARYPQLFFNWGLLFIGVGLGWFYYPQKATGDFFSFLVVLNLVLVIFCTWFFSVLINDKNDLKIDKISNQDRPLIKKLFTPKEYQNYLIIFFLFSVSGAVLVSPFVFLIVVSYHLLTFLYSCQPFRLKKFVGVSGFLISLASLNFLLIGFLIFSFNQGLAIFPWRVYWFLFGAYFFITPLKDLKDLEGDRKNQIWTLPVLVGREKARLITASFLFSFYLASVWILSKTDLFLVALLFGGISFWLVNDLRINERKLSSWVLGLVFVYGLLVVRVVFF